MESTPRPRARGAGLKDQQARNQGEEPEEPETPRDEPKEDTHMLDEVRSEQGDEDQ